MGRTDQVLAIFARYPRKGKVKTRLAGSIGEAEASELYRSMLFDSLERLSGLDCAKQVHFTDCTVSEGRSLLARVGLCEDYQIALQEGGTLGERMWNATRELLESVRKAVIVGSDAPTLPLSYIKEAFNALNRVSVVVGPVVDGGYYLVGSSVPRSEIFQNIPWGTESVLAATLQKLEGISHHLLPIWYDVDTASDLDRLRRELRADRNEKAVRLRSFLELPAFHSGMEKNDDTPRGEPGE